MNRFQVLGVLLCAAALAACDKNAVQPLPTAPLLESRIKFFHFGVGAPAINFYAGDTKMTAVSPTTPGRGVAYTGAGNGGAYSTIAAGPYTFTARVPTGADSNLAIATLATTVDADKFYSFYISGIYNTTLKTVDAFIVEDPVVPPSDYAVAYVRFVNAISNATNALTLYAKNTTGDTATVTVATAVAYKGASPFITIPAGIFNLFARYPDSTANKVTRNAVSFLGGRVYTIGARGNITVLTSPCLTTSTTCLDNTANR